MNFLKHILLLLLLSIGVNSYAQVLYGLIRWKTDHLETVVLEDKEHRDAWAKGQLPFSLIMYSKDFSANGININVTNVMGCSGIACYNTYIFIEEKGMWYLAAKTELSEFTTIDISDNKIIIKSDSGNVGELPFEALKISDESRKCANLIEHMDELGKDESPILNETEGTYLNLLLRERRGGFDFIGKKVAFLTGSSGTTKSDKTDYFKLQNDKFSTNEEGLYISNNGENLYIFNATQKEESGGYDAAIVYWSKFILPVEKVIKILKKNSKHK